MKYARKDNLIRHQQNHSNINYECEHCGFTTKRKDVLTKHMKRKHDVKKSVQKEDDVQPQRKRQRIENVDQLPEERVRNAREKRSLTTTALNDGVENIQLQPSNNEERYDLMLFFKEKQVDIVQILEDRLLRNNIKFYISVHVRMIKYSPDGKYDEAEPHFNSKVSTILQSGVSEIPHELNKGFQKVFISFEEFIKNGSGWQLEEVLQLNLCVTKYKPLKGGSYLELPTSLKRSNCILNIQNLDNKCFLWTVLSSMHNFQRNPENVENYVPFVNSVNMTGIEYPTPLSQISQFEKQNNTISVNIFGYEEGEIYPLYITKKTFCHHVNMLYFKENNKSHYMLINNFNRFLSRTKKHREEHFFCYLCLQGFTDKCKLERHKADCGKFDFQKITLPKEGEVLEFKEYAKTARIPFVIYADFECLTRKVDICHPNPNMSSTTTYQQMEPYSFGYQRVSIDKRYDKPPVIYRGPDVVENFIRRLLEEEKEIRDILNRIEPMIITEYDKLDYKYAKKCYVCKKAFSSKNYKVKEHDHVTGSIRGISCNNCNLQIKIPKFIPVVIHNLKGFDANLIMSKIGKFKEQDITVIPHNKEKYMSFSIGNLRFIDSLQFLNSSLATLTKNLADEGQKHFNYLSKTFPDPDVFSLLLRKGVFPYDYVDTEQKFEKPCLPSKEDFFNKLGDTHISDEDYQFAQTVWDKLKVKTLGEYSDVYLKMDVALLADVFEKFRDISLHDYDLDPCHYFTTPGFSWSAMLKKTGIVLDLITDIDMMLFVEKGIRGGVSSIFHRYAKANNPYLFDTYEPTEPTSYLSYLDANNLYGWSMSQCLPYGHFNWLTEEEKIKLDITKLKADGSDGYIFEVDLEYPTSLHSSHSDFPLAPERKHIQVEHLSPYSKELLQNITGKQCLTKIEKLVPNLYDKEKYIVHYRNLQLYVELGLKIKKIHRVLKFKQCPWLKKYIDFNTEKRKNAKNEFEKCLYKLMNNSIFGRTLLNTRKHKDVKLCHTEEKLNKETAKPSYASCKIFNENLVAVEKKRVNVLMKQPIYVGFCILDLSKFLMYDFHYNHMKSLYGDKIRVCFSDTDSFLYHVETEDVYEDMHQYQDMYDTSDYPPEHFLHDIENKKVIGKFKDETSGTPISEFVGLRSKMYSFSFEGGEKHTAKGVTKTASRKLKHEMYKNCLFDKTVTRSEMNIIRSESHVLYSKTINKKSLVPFDDKRWILNDGVTTRAFGHKDNI
ncbi:uncharacterized protein [Mytilus edulis]|uniref:uncharacterized protein n=1 Tax=Mytilus edulis TaxID=6550 RepID=UPI0039F08E6E